MLKKYLPTVITVLLIAAAIFSTVKLVPRDRFAEPTPTVAVEEKEEEKITAVYDIQYNSGMLLCGGSEAPYSQGDLKFFSQTKGIYRYKDYGPDETPETLKDGFDASSWPIIGSDGIVSGTDCRNITVVSTDVDGIVKEYANFDYIPGVIYGYSNPGQYDDRFLYNKENPSLEDERAIKLASNLFKSSKTSYYNSEFGCIIQGFLSKYSITGGVLEGYYHTGTDFAIMDGQSFYSPVNGVITYATQEDDYNMIIIYNEEFDISVIILHGNDISPATDIFMNSGEVKIGDKLGVGGGKGNPVGEKHIHIEVRMGKAERYKSFSKDILFTRMTNYDPLILTEIFDLQVLQADGYEPFSKVRSNSFDSQNNSSVVLVGNWLYYIDKENGSALFKARPDGSETTKLVSSVCANLNYYDGWLYYSDLLKNGVLMKTSVDGSQTIQVTKINSAAFVQVFDEWIYFADALSKNAISRVRHDGSEPQQLVKKNITDIFYHDGGIYYIQDASTKKERLYRFDIATMKSQQLIASRVDKPFVYNNQLCYRRYYGDKNCVMLPYGVYDENKATVFIPTAYNQVCPGYKSFVFINENDANCLYIKFDGKEELVKLSNDIMCSELTFQGGWLYYYGPAANGYRLSRINIYGMKKQRLGNNGMWVVDEFDAEMGFSEIVQASRTDTEFPSPLPDLTPMPSETPAGATPYPTPTPYNPGTPNPDDPQLDNSEGAIFTATPKPNTPVRTTAPARPPATTKPPATTAPAVATTAPPVATTAPPATTAPAVTTTAPPSAVTTAPPTQSEEPAETT